MNIKITLSLPIFVLIILVIGVVNYFSYLTSLGKPSLFIFLKTFVIFKFAIIECNCFILSVTTHLVLA